jgi:hypothetical protein
VREEERTKERERVVGKAAGDECVFIPGEGPGWQMSFRSDAIPDRVGGEGGHGVRRDIQNQLTSARDLDLTCLVIQSLDPSPAAWSLTYVLSQRDSVRKQPLE